MATDAARADLWEALGAIEDDQAIQALTQLFVFYEKRAEAYPDDPEACSFFRQLAAILAQIQSCNVSRR